MGTRSRSPRQQQSGDLAYSAESEVVGGGGGVQLAQINGEKGATGEKAHGENINLNST